MAIFSFLSALLGKKQGHNTAATQGGKTVQQPPTDAPQGTAVTPVIQTAPPIVLTPHVVQHKITTLSGAGSIFKGDLLAADSVYVAGVHLGNIKVTGQGRIVGVREKAVVEGSIEAETVLVGGEITGTVRCRVLKIYSTGVVSGDVEYERIIICEGGKLNASGIRNSQKVAIGAVFNGNCSTEDRVKEADDESAAEDPAPSAVRQPAAPIDLRAVMDQRFANEQKSDARYASDIPKVSVG